MDYRKSPYPTAHGGRPKTAKECADEALLYSFDTHIPLKIYIRTFRMIFKEANVYWGEGNLSQAYMLMYRASDLVLKKVGTHPESKTPEGRRMIKDITGQAGQVIRDLETLKPLVNEQYEEWERTSSSKRPSNGYREMPSSSRVRQSVQYSPTVLDARDQQNQSLNQVLEGVNHRASITMGRKRRGPIYAQEHDEQRRDDFYDTWDVPTPEPASSRESDEEYTRRQMEAARRQLDASDTSRASQTEEDAYSRSYTSYAPSYPTLRPSRPVELPPRQSSSRPSEPPFPPPNAPLPPRPPKDQSREAWRPTPTPPLPPREEPSFNRPPSCDNEYSIAPLRPQKVPMDRPHSRRAEIARDLSLSHPQVELPPARPLKVAEEIPPSKPKKDDVVFEPADFLESGDPLRPMFVPDDLREKFLEVAEPNTRRGLELCGLLCGNLHNNALFVTTLLIPEQECSDNTCDTVNEGSIWQFCDDNDVLVMGWIHTHPTQTCFLSSRDLHTHAVYQVQLPESVAIVCAPKFNEYGIFRCTDPPGKQIILKCTQPGIFHPHDPYRDDELYKTCGNRSGHVVETNQLSATLIDIRP